MKLKHKIIGGFSLLSVLMIASGLFSIYELTFVNNKVQEILENNYKSLVYAGNMLEFIEKENSAVLLLMHNDWKNATKILQKSDVNFSTNYQFALKNITESKEDSILKKINKNYKKFKSSWQQPISGTSKSNNLDWYYVQIFNRNSEIKGDIEALINLNQKSMYSEAKYIRERKRRAILPGIIAIISAIAFSLLFTFFINRYTIRPLKKIIKKINLFSNNENSFDVGIKTNDELKELEKSIQNLIYEIRQS